jgi:hypothetical protein
MAHVSHWQEIFQDDADRERFPSTLGEACGKTLWQVHAYCLMHKPARCCRQSLLAAIRARA